MSSELRHRSVATQQSSQSTSESEIMMTKNYEEAHLSAHALQAASPIHCGTVIKIHVPAIYSFLPATIQWFISRCCPKAWSPTWKRRHLIAIGGYLYRFKDENSSSPKGAPIAVSLTEAQIISNDNSTFDSGGEFNVMFDRLPDGYNAIFELSSIGKTQYFAVESKEEANIWVNTIKQMRQEAISRAMGHTNIPYPKEWTSFDASAKRLCAQKQRIKNKLEEMNKKEQEMQSLGGGVGGPMSMGYYS